MSEVKYWDINPVKSKKCDINIVVGKRSNGKTFGALYEGLQRIASGSMSKNKICLIRRTDADFKSKNGAQTSFNGIVSKGYFNKLFPEWDGITYYAGNFYRTKKVADKNGEIKLKKDIEPICYGFTLNNYERYKSGSFLDADFIVFDEFLTNSGYLTNEFKAWENMLSTIIRDRDNVTIYMLANTVNKYGEYIEKMNLQFIRQMHQGEIRTVKTPKGLKICVEYCETGNATEKSDKYFDFDNHTSRMITKGDWEIQSYPHAPIKWNKEDIYFTYYIEYVENVLEVNMICKGVHRFSFVHPKRGDIKHRDTDYYFSDRVISTVNAHTYINLKYDAMSEYIVADIKNGRMYCSDDDTGDVLRNYILWCKSNLIYG